jgi:hypothetical protein
MKLPSNGPSDEIVLPHVPPIVPRVPPAVKARVLACHLAGESNRKIAKTLGMSKDTVARILKEAQMGPHAQGSVEQALERAGLTTDALLAHAKQGLMATETKLVTFEGKFTDEREVADNTTRHKYWHDAAKMAGMFPREDAAPVTQLLVRLPIAVLVPGHSESCTCRECWDAWNALPELPTATEDNM